MGQLQQGLGAGLAQQGLMQVTAGHPWGPFTWAFCLNWLPFANYSSEVRTKRSCIFALSMQRQAKTNRMDTMDALSRN